MKAPKLRFKPGQFLKHKKTGDIVCIRYCFRLKSDPFVWIFYLEDRKSTNNPSTALSVACTGSLSDSGIIDYNLYKSGIDADYHIARQFPGGMYRFGDSCMRDNQRVMNEYEVLSNDN